MGISFNQQPSSHASAFPQVKSKSIFTIFINTVECVKIATIPVLLYVKVFPHTHNQFFISVFGVPEILIEASKENSNGRKTV